MPGFMDAFTEAPYISMRDWNRRPTREDSYRTWHGLTSGCIVAAIETARDNTEWRPYPICDNAKKYFGKAEAIPGYLLRADIEEIWDMSTFFGMIWIYESKKLELIYLDTTGKSSFFFSTPKEDGTAIAYKVRRGQFAEVGTRLSCGRMEPHPKRRYDVGICIKVDRGSWFPTFEGGFLQSGYASVAATLWKPGNVFYDYIDPLSERRNVYDLCGTHLEDYKFNGFTCDRKYAYVWSGKEQRKYAVENADGDIVRIRRTPSKNVDEGMTMDRLFISSAPFDAESLDTADRKLYDESIAFKDQWHKTELRVLPNEDNEDELFDFYDFLGQSSTFKMIHLKAAEVIGLDGLRSDHSMIRKRRMTIEALCKEMRFENDADLEEDTRTRALLGFPPRSTTSVPRYNLPFGWTTQEASLYSNRIFPNFLWIPSP